MSEWESGGVGERGTGGGDFPANAGTGARPRSESTDPAVPGNNAHSPAPPLSRSDVTAISPDEVLAWLDARESRPPPELRERMATALAGAKSETLPGALAEAALACLQATVERPEERASALDLLAADALLTYALEAAAELGAETLGRIAGEYGPEALGRILPEERDA